MTLYINLRGGDYGAVCDPYLLTGDWSQEPPGMTSLEPGALPALVKGKDVLIATHGFNVSYVNGLRTLGRLEALVQPTANEMFLGVLWPGDWVIPAINYPFAEKIAVQAGTKLGRFCNSWLSGARSIAFASHSLGARVVMNAVELLAQPARVLCVTAGAVNADCFSSQYAQAASNAAAVATLSSEKDMVLALAYPPGDFIADILDDDHRLFERALGLKGPDGPRPAVVAPSQIANSPPYDHGDYFPPSDLATLFPDPNANWWKPTQFVARAFRGERQNWP